MLSRFYFKRHITILDSRIRKSYMNYLKMQCRACLKTSCENTTRLDEHNTKNFNLITNLSINMEDSMPQQLCENCTKDLEFCVEFREKCITSNSVLLSALSSIEDSKITTQIKQEDNSEYDEINYTELNEKVDIKVKVEYNDLENHETLQTENNFVYEYISDKKQPKIEDSPTQTSVSSKEKTRKMAPKTTRKMASRAVKKEINTSNKKASKLIKFHCGLCTEKVEKDKLCDHVKSHESNNYCGICSLYLKDWETMLYHRISHLQKPSIICHICLRVFQTPVSMEYHYNIKHLGKIKEHKLRIHTAEKVCCKLCKALFKDESRLKLHKCQYSTHSICPVCGVVIQVPGNMRRHLAGHSDERRYKCDRCDAAYKTPESLRVHQNKHDGVRPYKCEYCSATFGAKPTLTKHRRVHTGEKPYVCKVCNKGFTANNNLKVHMKVHGVFNLIKKKGTKEDSIVQLSNKSSPIDFTNTL